MEYSPPLNGAALHGRESHRYFHGVLRQRQDCGIVHKTLKKGAPCPKACYSISPDEQP